MNDPTSKTHLQAGECTGAAVAGLFASAHLWDWDNLEHVTVLHLICPAPTFTDRGTTTLSLPPAVAEELGNATWAVTMTAYREWEKAVKDSEKQRRQAQAASARAAVNPTPPSIRDTVLDKVLAAYTAGGGQTLPISSRTVYYQARPLVDPVTGGTLDYKYFGQLLAEFDREHPGLLPNLYYEARGELVEPHTGNQPELGTREVAGYVPGEWPAQDRTLLSELDFRPGKHLYDKILYVEKEGLAPVFEAARLAERYDMGLMFGQGYANVAARVLASRLQTDHDTIIFVLHDADLSGYNIAIALAEKTARMPEHRIEVVDLGLTWGAAMQAGLLAETVKRKKAVPDRVLERLDDDERAAFVGELTNPGKAKPVYRAQRVELNVFTSTALVSYVEAGLRAHGADKKVVPPADVAEALAVDAQHELVTRWAAEQLAADLGLDGIIEKLVEEFAPNAPEDLIGTIASAQAEDRATYWPCVVVERTETDLVSTEDAQRARFTELLRERIDRLIGES